MKGKTETLELAQDAPEYLTDNGIEAQSGQEVQSLEDFLSTSKRKYERTVINGRVCHFEGGSPRSKDALIAKHSRDDGMGNTSVSQEMWRTDAIALTWVTGPGGKRILDTKEKAERFYSEADADEELEMYKVAARMLGIKEPEAKETARKNSGNGGGSFTTSTLFPENSSPS
jgi:hypothetical protein